MRTQPRAAAILGNLRLQLNRPTADEQWVTRLSHPHFAAASATAVTTASKAVVAATCSSLTRVRPNPGAYRRGTWAKSENGGKDLISALVAAENRSDAPCSA